MYSGDCQEFQLPNLVIQASPQPRPHVLLPCLGYLPAASLMMLSRKRKAGGILSMNPPPTPTPSSLSLCLAREKKMDKGPHG